MEWNSLEALSESEQDVVVDEDTSERLRWLLSDCGDKQDALAAALDVSPSTISRWVRAQSKPQPRHRKTIAALWETRRFASARAHALAELNEEQIDDDQST